MRKYLWLLPAFLALWGGAFAQPAKINKADQYFKQGNYLQAIPIYEEVQGSEDLAKVKLRLAEAYRFIGNYQSSAKWYALVIAHPESRPEHKYYYGLMLLRSGDCEAAERWFKDYLKYNPYDPRKQRLLNACAYTQELAKDQSERVTISLPGFNTPESELGPAYYNDGLVFSAFRRNAENPSKAFLDLFRITIEENGESRNYSSPKLLSSTLQTEFHEGLATFNKEETEIYYTGTRKVAPHSPLEREIHRLEIVTAQRLPQGGWSNLKPLSFSSDDFSVVHPSLSADGKRLFFSSDMPGGRGGKDLYLSFFENGQWGPPINLGPAVNTPDDEVFPFISDSGKLYFSSNGHLGLGGQDIFWTEEGYDGLWVLPHNMGTPFNAEADDFGIIFNSLGTEGYFTSNRAGGIGKDDIYGFRMAPRGTTVQVDVVDISTGDPVPFAKVVNSCDGDTLQANAQGHLLLHLSECCTLTGMAKRYQPRSLEACQRTGELAADTLFIALALGHNSGEEPEPDKAQAQMEEPEKTQVISGFGQYQLSGTVFNQESGKPVFDAEVKFNSLNCPSPVSIFTDKQGSFRISLEEACCYKVRVERDNFFAHNLEKVVCAKEEAYDQFLNLYITPYAADPTSDAGGESIPVKMDTQTKEFGFYRSSEEESNNFSFRMNVYYDVGRTSIQYRSVTELFRLLQLMRDNPDIILEISSHTDANGDSESNQELSQKRADSIVRYLVRKGISKKRLVAKGYGESRLTNHCTNGVTCSEEEHQQNRRTEFQVLGKVN